MPFFPNELIELYSYNETLEYDDVTGELLDSYVLRETVPADVQTLSHESQKKLFGDIVQDTYKVYLDSQVNVNSTDQVKIVGNTRTTYEIIGSPENNNHLLFHKKIIIKKQRKKIKKR